MGYTKAMLDEVKRRVTIPSYFYNIIIPQRVDYYSDYTVDFDAKPVAKCPLHDEDTPSMRYYEETNTFYCFGCRKGGDVINLHREFTEVLTDTKPSFGEAVVFLYNFFISGKETTALPKTTNKLIKEEVASSNIDLMRYNKYSVLLEQQLLEDSHVPEDVKRTLWDCMDNLDILVSENVINAVDAMNYIQGKVKEVIR